MTWPRPWAWADVNKARQARKTFAPSKAAERRYRKQLQSVAAQVGKAVATGTPESIESRLREYAEAVEPWARQAATNMMRDAAKHNEEGWRKAAQAWGIDLRRFLEADISEAVDKRIEENVRLISSIPSQAADRVAELAKEAQLSGGRAASMMGEIQKQGEVSASRARVIALTEVSKAGTALTRARAESVGSDGYIWRTARDGHSRPSHAAMEGRFVKWSDPPTLDGMTGHAGEFPNCRCYPEPVVHDSAGQEVASPLPSAEQEKRSGRHELRSQWERQAGSEVVPHMQGESLHNAERATFDRDKLTRYALDTGSAKGESKARVFRAALGMDKRHAADLERQIMQQLAGRPAARRQHDQYGERFRVVVPVTGPNGRTVDVTTGWIYDRDETGVATKPRLTTCYIEE